MHYMLLVLDLEGRPRQSFLYEQQPNDLALECDEWMDAEHARKGAQAAHKDKHEQVVEETTSHMRLQSVRLGWAGLDELESRNETSFHYAWLALMKSIVSWFCSHGWRADGREHGHDGDEALVFRRRVFID